MKKITSRTIVAAAFCCVGLIAAVFTFVRLQGRDTVQVLRSSAENDVAERSKGFVGIDAVGIDAVVERVSDALSRRAAEALLPDRDALVADAGAILRAWLGGTGDDYLAYLDASGDPPPPAAVWEDPVGRDAAWRNSTRELREARFDPDGVFIHTSYSDGVPIPDEAMLNGLTGWRMDKLSGFDIASPSKDILEASGIEMHEVRIPMRTKGHVGRTDFLGQLSLSYAQDPGTARWKLVAVSVYDIPLGDTARIPPF